MVGLVWLPRFATLALVGYRSAVVALGVPPLAFPALVPPPLVIPALVVPLLAVPALVVLDVLVMWAADSPAPEARVL